MIEFHPGLAPKGFKIDFESFLFNTKAHRLTQSKTGWKEFHLLDTGRKKILASLIINIKGKTARSPLKAPFGSFEVSPKLKPKYLIQFIKHIEDFLFSEGIKKIEIVCPPELLSSTQALISSSLSRAGYSSQSDVGCCILVDEMPLTSRMQPDKLSRFKKSVNAGLEFKLIPLNRLKEVYQFIESNFIFLERKLSLSYLGLKKIVDFLPGKFFLIGVYKGKILTTAAICIYITPTIIYTFYSAHSKVYDKLSPRVFLINELYNLCFRRKIKIIDLGTSMINGRVNHGLHDFKIRIGGVPTSKFTFQKSLA